MNICRNISHELDTKLGNFSKQSFVANIPNTDETALAAVSGNLEGLASLGEAQIWVKDNLVVLEGPAPKKKNIKGIFKGLIFADFADAFERGLAVAL